MYTALIILHVIVALLLIVVVLVQSGRGGGLVEGFAGGAESIFGTKTPKFMTRLTAVLATIFIINCLALTIITTQRSKPLMEKELKAVAPQSEKQ